MIQDKELQLLIDLCQLLNKHGIATFENLLKEVKNLDLTSLETLGEIARKFQTKGRKKVASKPKNYLDEAKILIENTIRIDGEKFPAMQSILENLVSKSKLKTLSELSNFLLDNGIIKKKIESRPQGIFLVISNILNGKLDREKYEWLEVLDSSNSDRSLGAWSKIIMRDKKPEAEK